MKGEGFRVPLGAQEVQAQACKCCTFSEVCYPTLPKSPEFPGGLRFRLWGAEAVLFLVAWGCAFRGPLAGLSANVESDKLQPTSFVTDPFAQQTQQVQCPRGRGCTSNNKWGSDLRRDLSANWDPNSDGSRNMPSTTIRFLMQFQNYSFKCKLYVQRGLKENEP